MTLRLPRQFMTDRQERDLPCGRVSPFGAGWVLVTCDAPTLADIESDADYYGDASGGPDMLPKGLRASARRTLAAIKTYCAQEEGR